MKTIIVLILLPLFCISVSAQELPIDINGIWSVYKEKYFADGDTIINQKQYTKIYVSETENFQDSLYQAALRQEADSKRVYLVMGNTENEFLLYDFSLEVGDTVSDLPRYYPAVKVVVESIDSVLLGQRSRKRIKVTGTEGFSYEDEYWIEGIGSTYGLLDPGLVGVVYFDIIHPSLLCFEDDGELVYSNPMYGSCFEGNPVHVEETVLHNRLDIFPNPVRDNFWVHADQSIQSYVISNVRGEQMHSAEIRESDFQVNISLLKEGIYFLSLKTETGLISKKIIKI